MIDAINDILWLRFASEFKGDTEELLSEGFGLAGELGGEGLHALSDVAGGAGEVFVVGAGYVAANPADLLTAVLRWVLRFPQDKLQNCLMELLFRYLVTLGKFSQLRLRFEALRQT